MIEDYTYLKIKEEMEKSNNRIKTMLYVFGIFIAVSATLYYFLVVAPVVKNLDILMRMLGV